MAGIGVHDDRNRCSPSAEPAFTLKRNECSRWAGIRIEAQILRNGELVIGRRFVLKEQAIRWAEEEKAHVGDRMEDWE